MHTTLPCLEAFVRHQKQKHNKVPYPLGRLRCKHKQNETKQTPILIYRLFYQFIKWRSIKVTYL